MGVEGEMNGNSCNPGYKFINLKIYVFENVFKMLFSRYICIFVVPE